MSTITERTLGLGFSVLGGILIVVAALVALAVGITDVALGRSFEAMNAATEAVVLLVIGGLALFFGYLARKDWKERPFAAGILLIVTALIGWGVLGLGANFVALIGAI